MGSIDLKFSLATFEECMLVSYQFDKEIDGVIRPSRTAINADVVAGVETEPGQVCKVGGPIPDDGTSTRAVYVCPANKKYYTVEKNILDLSMGILRPLIYSSFAKFIKYITFWCCYSI